MALIGPETGSLAHKAVGVGADGARQKHRQGDEIAADQRHIFDRARVERRRQHRGFRVQQRNNLRLNGHLLLRDRQSHLHIDLRVLGGFQNKRSIGRCRKTRASTVTL